MGYTQFIQGKLDQMVNNADKSYNDIEDLFLNNWQNDKLVRPVDMYGGKYQAPLRSVSLNKDAAMPNIIFGQRTDMQAAVIKPLNWVTVDDIKYPIFPPYVKVKDSLGFEPANWHVYRLIGYIDKPERTWKGKLTGRILYTPIYGLISKKGYSYKGHTIVEYGLSTQFEFNKENEWDYFEALNNLDALSDMTDEVERTYFEQDKAYMHHIGELPSYSGMNYAIAEQDRIFEYEQDEVDDSVEGVVLEEADDNDTENAVTTYVNHSGGAIGSDTMWGEIGEEYGVVSNHYYHGTKTPNGNIEITEEQFERGKQHVYKANETLHRRPDKYMNLLARNWIQVENSDAVFAIGQLKNNVVDGGTGWAVQMAIDVGKPVYVFDQDRNKWYTNVDKDWIEIGTPTLTPNFAGIGTRNINQNGIKAIRDVYENTFRIENLPNDIKKLNFDEVASKVFDLVNKLGIQTVLVDQSQLIQSATIAQFDSDNNRIKLRKDYEDYVKEAGISLNNLLLHEYIHVITSYAIDNADKMSADVQAAVKTIKATYKTLLEKEKDNYVDFMGSILPDSNDYYGLKSEYEMIAELANPNFRKILSKHNLLDRLISNIKDLIFKLFDKFGISHNPTLEDSLVASLDTLIDNFDSMIYNDWNKTRTAQRWFRDNIQRVSINKYIGNKVMDQVNTQLENEPYEEVAELIINIPTDIARDIYNQLGGQNAKNKPFILSFDGGSIMFARLTGLKSSDKKMQGIYTELDTYDMTIETHPEIIPIEEYEKAGNQYKPLADVGSTQALTGIDLVSLYDQGNRRVSEVLDQLSDLTQEERQTYLNEFAQYMRDNNINTQDKLEEALRKFICNL